ncbi:MAG: protein-export chaperone SecB [Bacilli bacterium]
MTEKKSQFKFETYKILKSEIEIADFNNVSPNINIEFSKEENQEEDNQFNLILTCSITDENQSLKVYVKAMGVFEFDSHINESILKIFFKTNAPAILFPYVRAYISSLTALSGISPIIIPTLNLSDRQ